MFSRIRDWFNDLSPQALNWISRLSFLFSIAGGIWAVRYPEARLISGSAALASVGLLFWTREVSHVRNQRLRRLIEELEKRPLPQDATAAAIAGQSDLATMNYSGLVDKLRRDGHIE
jgi:hypothetical protein